MTFSEFLIDLIDGRESVHIALSGGSTPKVVFDVLAEHFGSKIVWSKLHLYWGDERCVPPDDAESNYKMTVDHLLSKVAIPKKNIHRIKGENDPQKEAKRYARILGKNLPVSAGLPQFDLVILGMGDDGHTASIFPNALALWDKKSYCVVAEHPDSGQKRITITGQLINNAKAVAFLVTGANKSGKVREIILKEGNFKKYPATRVDPISGNLYWFLDPAAADGVKGVRS